MFYVSKICIKAVETENKFSFFEEFKIKNSQIWKITFYCWGKLHQNLLYPVTFIPYSEFIYLNWTFRLSEIDIAMIVFADN